MSPSQRQQGQRPLGQPKPRPENMADRIYLALKEQIFAFALLPGDRFSETEVAERMQASRTPVREALYRLQKEGFVEVQFRSGWQVRPFDFEYFEDLYDVRIVLEEAAVQRLCDGEQQHPAFAELLAFWLVPPDQRLSDGAEVSRQDERFHNQLIVASGNRQMAQIHWEISEKIRIIRRLDFTQAPRVEATYNEHGAILRAIVRRRTDEAKRLLRSHIAASKAEVRKITLHMLHSARSRAAQGQETAID